MVKSSKKVEQTGTGLPPEQLRARLIALEMLVDALVAQSGAGVSRAERDRWRKGTAQVKFDANAVLNGALQIANKLYDAAKGKKASPTAPQPKSRAKKK